MMQRAGLVKIVAMGAVVGVLMIGTAWGLGQPEQETRAPVPPSPPMEQAPAPAEPVARRSLADVAFFEGRWVGKVGDNVVEEQWSGARGTSMMGMFRWLVADGSPYMFELMTMTQEEGGVVLRLRHFGAGLEAKEEKDKPMVMRLGEAEAGKRAVFVAEPGAAGQASRVIYERTGPRTCLI